MGKLTELLIDIEERLMMGYAANEVADQLGVSIEWVIDTELELMGMHQHDGDEE